MAWPHYRAPWWLPGGHAQTIWAAVLARRTPAAMGAMSFRREPWTTPDGDRIVVDWLETTPALRLDAPLLVQFHGLEGSSSSHYVQALAAAAAQRGWRFCVPHFRGCGGVDNLAPRAYHSGDHAEIDWILQRLRAGSAAPLWVVGVSLGGNALLRWAQESGEAASRSVRGLAAISAPLDLMAAGTAMGQGFNRWVYTRMFLRTMQRKAIAKARQFPGLFDLDRALAARTLAEFDDVFTAPLHGFAGVTDYWTRASSKPGLRSIRVPACVLNARNDPFLPAHALPDWVPGDWVELVQPEEGGHVGFPQGGFPGQIVGLAEQVLGWFDRRSAGSGGA